MEYFILGCEYIRSKCTGTYRYEYVARQCMSINVLYSKFIQSLAAKYNTHFQIDQIPFSMSEVVVPDIQNPTIIGSGMVSIVFEGIKNDKLVIIKTKRKGIDKKIHDGIQSLYQFASWIDFFTYSKYGMVSIVHNVSDVMISQLDFEQEAINHRKFSTMFAYNKSIVIPELYESTDTLVMSKLIGKQLRDLSPEEKEFYAQQLITVIVKSLIIDGFIHLDFHIGNVVFMENQLGILDFGLMLELSKTERDTLLEILKDFASSEYTSAATKTIAFIHPVSRLNTLSSSEKNDIIQSFSSIYQQAHEVEHSVGLNDIVAMKHLLQKYKLELIPLFYKFGMSIATVDLLLKELSSSSFTMILAKLNTLFTS
jgi:predicted unusual protein kinase regulating ubiquinone biosynthesis (AarF/ABC1/UbiB family)